MLLISNKNIVDPRTNLAIEEHLLRTCPIGEDFLFLYVNEPCIIIGRNQNALEEINIDYISANNIPVIRRLSGGGAVYHDLGNLNFSFITKYKKENFNNFKKFLEPVVKTLLEIGINAELGKRNEILVEGRKISGNAQYIAGSRMVSHGTLLFNSDLYSMEKALHVNRTGITSKAIKSVPSRVGNIIEFTHLPMDLDQLRLQLINQVNGISTESETYSLNEGDWQNINKLKEERYNSWEWNYGRSPDFTIERVKHLPDGEIEVKMNIQRGYITRIKLSGENKDASALKELEEKLLGARYEKQYLTDLSTHLNLANTLPTFSDEDFVRFLY